MRDDPFERVVDALAHFLRIGRWRGAPQWLQQYRAPELGERRRPRWLGVVEDAIEASVAEPPSVADLAGLDGRGQRTVVGDDLQPPAGDHLVGRALPREQPVEDLSRELVVDAALVDERLHTGHVGRSDAQVGDLDAPLVGPPRQVMSASTGTCTES